MADWDHFTSEVKAFPPSPSALIHKYPNVFQAHLAVRQLAKVAAAFRALSLLRSHSLGAASCAEPKRKQACALQICHLIYEMVYLVKGAALPIEEGLDSAHSQTVASSPLDVPTLPDNPAPLAQSPLVRGSCSQLHARFNFFTPGSRTDPTLHKSPGLMTVYRLEILAMNRKMNSRSWQGGSLPSPQARQRQAEEVRLARWVL